VERVERLAAIAHPDHRSTILDQEVSVS